MRDHKATPQFSRSWIRTKFSAYIRVNMTWLSLREVEREWETSFYLMMMRCRDWWWQGNKHKYRALVEWMILIEQNWNHHTNPVLLPLGPPHSQCGVARVQTQAIERLVTYLNCGMTFHWDEISSNYHAVWCVSVFLCCVFSYNRLNVTHNCTCLNYCPLSFTS